MTTHNPDDPREITRLVIARAVRGSTRPQQQLASVNGHEHRAEPAPVLLPLGVLCHDPLAQQPPPQHALDVDLAAIERSAQRRAERAAQRAELDAALAERALEHDSTRGEFHQLDQQTRSAVIWIGLFMLSIFVAIVVMAVRAYWLQRGGA